MNSHNIDEKGIKTAKGNDWKNTQSIPVLKRYQEKMFRQQIIYASRIVWSKNVVWNLDISYLIDKKILIIGK